jgi:translation initiation factor 4A
MDFHEFKTSQVVVGTPGRVFDMIQRGVLRVQSLRQLVLDEADEMLSHGFRDAIYEIFQLLPNDGLQVCLFSATMPRECLELTKQFMVDPLHILIKTEQVTLDGIQQYYVNVYEERYKLETLCDLYDTISVTQAVIFCNTRRKVEWLADQLEQRDFTVSSMHGDTDFAQRQAVMSAFRSGSSRILLTTNLVARGIDVQTVSLVINYDIPRDKESYIHRIGRSGRYGRKGVAINFANEDEGYQLQELERFYDTQIKELPQNIAQLI